MKWNLDFEISAIFFEAILLVYYFSKRHLPTKKNLSFIISMSVGCTMTALDVVTSVMDSYWYMFPLELLNVLNVLFFVTAALNSIFLFIFVLALTDQLDILKTPLFMIFCVPFMIDVVLAISTPYTGAFYHFDPALGYIQGSAYLTNFVLNSFYLLLCTIYVVVYRKHMSTAQFVSVCAFLLLLLTGIILQSMIFRWVLLTNAFTCYAVCVLYLSLQNPDLFIDKETGLFNRDGLFEYMNELISSESRFSFMAINLDNYRSVRAVFGDEKIKKALLEIIAYVRQQYSDDHVFRYNDETYIVVTTNKYDVAYAIENGRRRAEDGFMIGGEHIKFSVSFFVYPYEKMGKTVEEVITILDHMIEHESSTATDIEINDEIISRSRRKHDVDIAIEKAIDNRSVQVYYMPIYSPFTEKMERVEALARIFDSNVGFVQPREFIQEAEQNGSIVALGRQIFEKICEFVKEQEPASYGIERVGVNLSGRQLMQEGFAEECIAIARKYEVGLDNFSFEITEASNLDHGDTVKVNMKKLADSGAEFALDGYGSGYSSIQNIMELPISMVKIDRSLVRSYFENSSMLLPDVIEMFRNQKLKIVLVGVETKDMARRLSVMGCDYLEGYYYSRTISARDVVALMKKQKTVDKAL